MFRKVAQARSLGTFDVESDGGIRVAQLVQDAAGVPPSYYLDGARKLDVRALLEKVGSVYAISHDPADYFFEAIRANTTNCPNENNDGFHQAELLRFDVKLGMPVYMTYAGKPHHLNHRTENAKAARGLIIDAHYNADAPSLETCPGCQTRTAERQNRDETGLHCRKCGTLVRDEFVEILVGIDARKDPLFAEGVRKGTLKAGSMGCNCLSTSCNVCGHVAYARPEFCEHIRSGNKGTLWVRKGSSWTKTSGTDVAKELRRRKLAFIPNDFCYVKAADFEARKAFEYCNQVIFDEYSRVDQPADPKALQVEVLNVRAAALTGAEFDPNALRSETEALIRSAEAKRKEAEAMARAAQRAPRPAPPTPADPYAMDQHGVGISLEPGDDPIVIEPPGGPGMPGQQPGIPGAPPGPGGPTGIEQYTDQQMISPEGPGQQPPPGEEMDMGELGVLPVPPGASAPAAAPAAPRRGGRRTEMRKFSQAYAKWTVQVSEQGNARLLTAPAKDNGVPVLVFRAAKPTQDPEERKAFGLEVLAHLHDHGLVSTAKKYGAYFSPKFAQVVDHATDDMKEFADKYMYSSVIENNRDDMQGNVRGTPPASTGTDGRDDMDGDVRGKPPASSQTDGAMDHEVKDQGVDSAVGEDHETMRDKRKPFNMSKNTVLQNEVHDHTEPLSSKKGEALPLGSRVAPKGEERNPWKVIGALAAQDEAEAKVHGTTSYMLARGAGTTYESKRIAASMLETWFLLDKQPSTMKLPGQPTMVAPRPVAFTAEQLQVLRAAGVDANVDAQGGLVVQGAAEKCAKCGKLMFGGAEKHECAGESKEAAAKRLAALEKREKLADAKLAKAKKDLETARADQSEQTKVAQQAAVAAFCRALRIVAERQGADLEASPLKMAAEAVLSEPRVIGKDAATGQPIEYRGFDPELTQYLVAHLYQVGHKDHLEQLIRRASQLSERGDQYLIDAEADLKNLNRSLPAITHSRVAEIDEDALHAAELRRQASGGNLHLTPAPSEIEYSANGHNKRSAIRGALGGTLVEAARGRLGLGPN